MLYLRYTLDAHFDASFSSMLVSLDDGFWVKDMDFMSSSLRCISFYQKLNGKEMDLLSISIIDMRSPRLSDYMDWPNETHGPCFSI